MTCERVVAAQCISQSSDLGDALRALPTITVSLPTKAAVHPPPPLKDFPLQTPVVHGPPYDYVVVAMYAKCDGLACRFMRVNLSPQPVQASDVPSIQGCFLSTSTIDNFVIYYDANMKALDCPLHVYYCATSYAERSNPNNALVTLTQSLSIACRRPWYGTVVVLKFANRACRNYVVMTVDDVLRARDYFAYFA
ncbi:hypothetical protein GSI_12004 [Ganoderma sinense ZZ0214-1]|uniref:Uncharacterized protein n=1 Tax=Ganoderma sinense ZZ0214-1 TaxID=1077348 RepID=A0A2G8RY51_9APHY|nr:hypothetical protein GSI_12004 [Ganoderma sinense ZZ0214-1]